MSVSQYGGDSRGVVLSELRSIWSVYSLILQSKFAGSGELSIQIRARSTAN
jgi:hypothetical protein